jgi:hypothetical protein
MAGFCGNCGAPVLGAFCSQCGAKTVSAGVPVQAPAVPPPSVSSTQMSAPAQVTTNPAWQASAVPQSVTVTPQMGAPIVPQPATGSGWGKVLLGFGIIVLVVILGAVGATVYGFYWVKHKVTGYASAITNSVTAETKVVANGDSCRLLSTADLQQVLGVTIEKSAEIVEGSDPGCAYYTNPTGVAKLQKMATEQARRQSAVASKSQGMKGDNPLALLKETSQMEGIVKGLTTSNPDANGKVFSFTIQRNFGSDSWSGMRLVESAVPGFEDVSGVGDHAMIGAFGHAFYMVKGETMIHMDTALVPDARTRGAMIGKKILARL